MPACAIAIALALLPGRTYEGTRAVVAPNDATQIENAPAALPSPGDTVIATPPRPTPPGVASPRPDGAHGKLRPRWLADGAIIVAATVPIEILVRAVVPRRDASARTTDPDVGPIDRAALGRFDRRAATASDVMIALALATVPTVTLVHGAWAARSPGPRRARRFASGWLGAALISTEAVVLTRAAGELIKDAVGRPRPYTALMPEDVDPSDHEALAELQRDPDSRRSFPSGHAALSFAAITAVATSLTIEHPRTRRSRAMLAAFWAAGVATAGTIAGLRVVAGRHFPSDVAAGAALGAGIGAATPLLHTCWLRRPWRPRCT